MANTTDPLFRAFRLGPATLPNRVVMAPLTRARAAQPGDVPTEMNARYYAQRAGTGLIISEATQVSPQGKGYAQRLLSVAVPLPAALAKAAR